MGEPGRSKSGATLASTATTILRRPGMRALAPIALGLLVGSAIARPAEAQVARVAVARVAVARVAVRAREPDVVVARRLRERLAALDVAVEPEPAQRFSFELEDTWRPYMLDTATATTSTVTKLTQTVLR